MKWTKGDNVPLNMQLKWDNGTNINLTDATVVFEMIPVDSNIPTISSAAIIITAIDGTVQYQWGAGETDNVGLYELRWVITYSSGKEYTVPNNHNEWIHIY